MTRTSRSSSAGLIVTAIALALTSVLLLFPGILGGGESTPATSASPAVSSTSPSKTVLKQPSRTAPAPVAAPSPALPSPDSTASVSPSPAPTDVDSEGGFIEASPTPSTSSEAAAALSAAQFMTAYARQPGDTQKKWWARVSSLLTAQGRQDYAYVPVEKIPVTKVTGRPTLELEPAPNGQDDEGEDGHSHLGLVVLTPTDAGVYAVSLVSDSAGGWLVSRTNPVDTP